MDNFMKGILSRVLSEEIQNQMKWKEQDKGFGFPDDVLEHRDDNIKRIRQFMHENNIEEQR